MTPLDGVAARRHMTIEVPSRARSAAVTATRRPVGRLAAALMAGGLAACSADISSHNIWAPGVPGYFAYAAAAGEVSTIVIGNPFGVPKETLDRAVTDAMQGRHHGPRTRFTTQPSDAARSHLRIVVMFDPPHTLDRRPGGSEIDISGHAPAQEVSSPASPAQRHARAVRRRHQLGPTLAEGAGDVGDPRGVEVRREQRHEPRSGRQPDQCPRVGHGQEHRVGEHPAHRDTVSWPSTRRSPTVRGPAR